MLRMGCKPPFSFWGQLEAGSSTFIVGKIFKAPFGGRGATLEISPAQRAGYLW
jgi:hypothetical protein